jgi:hypothetical protein
MNRLLLLFVCVFVAACGSGNNTTAYVPTAPTPPPAPTYPSMVGPWTGTTTITAAIVGGLSGSNTCTETWLVDSQSGGSFSGTFQTSGGTTTSCAQAGTFSGTVSTSGSLSVRFSSTLNPLTGCARTGGSDSFSGLLSGGTGTLQMSQTLHCTSPAVADVNVSYTISIHK